MAKATVERKPRAKQKHLPSMEPPSIPRLDSAATTYYEAMLERQKLTQEEKDAELNLRSIMAEEGLERYETPDGLLVVLLSSSKTRVKKKASPESNGDTDAV